MGSDCRSARTPNAVRPSESRRAAHLQPPALPLRRRAQSPGVGLMLFMGLGSTHSVDTALVPHPGLKSLCLWCVLVPGVAVPRASNSPGLREAEGRETQAGHSPPTLADVSRKGWWSRDKRRTCREPCVPYQGLHLLPLAQEETLLHSARLPVCPPCYKEQEKGEACVEANTHRERTRAAGGHSGKPPAMRGHHFNLWMRCGS